MSKKTPDPEEKPEDEDFEFPVVDVPTIAKLLERMKSKTKKEQPKKPCD